MKCPTCVCIDRVSIYVWNRLKQTNCDIFIDETFLPVLPSAHLSHVATRAASAFIGQSLDLSDTAQPIGKEPGDRAVIGRAHWSPELDVVYKCHSDLT